MSWWDYVQRTAGPEATHDDIGRASEVKASTVTRWKQGAGVDPATAAAFARYHRRPVLEAFIAAGYLTPEEAGATPTDPTRLRIEDVTDEEIMRELARRLAQRR